MKRLPLPGWIFILSTVLFIGAWILAPNDTLSGRLELPSPNVVERKPTETITINQNIVTSTKLNDERPKRVFGFDHPYELALTFDDGPHPYQTPRLLDILYRHQVKGTFFVNGMWLNAEKQKGKNRSILMQTHLEGHQIGNHTYSHQLLSDLTPEQQSWQIMSTEILVSELIGQRMRVFRPPYGQMTRYARTILEKYGYQEVMWNIAAREADANQNPELVARELLNWIQHHKGGILLLHDRLRWSVDATEILLARLHQLNCKRFCKKKPVYLIVGLDHFLMSQSESSQLAKKRLTERKEYEEQLSARCSCK